MFGSAGVGRPLTYLLPDLQRPLAQGLRLLVFSSLPVQDGQVVEGGGHLTEKKREALVLKKKAERRPPGNLRHPCERRASAARSRDTRVRE